ncbi:histone-lysine N-methyltransferase, H3 lysine-9 specific SUVH1-like [Thalictrum thalictroides]|uniref:Histone-lysine N-methyltransferase, H3 lysine-9 specific SUVH1-like n=1 Tax=Thalictrum thalictroides TaxID=46969 RepID=A0A7J6VN72_THATH|nr:histone-lysine N-methyltransferase, H3 lysine-9 specific SUVH1-like [Thalictrum thalictroides]
MEPSSSNGPFSGSYDKSKVLDVKPLRCLAPLFPSPPNIIASQSSSSSSTPFVCAPPFGPLPTGYSPFYPFYNASDSQTPLQHQTPRTPSDQIPLFRKTPPAPPQFGSEAGPSNKNPINQVVNSINEESSDDVWSNTERSEDLQSSHRGGSTNYAANFVSSSTVAEGTSNGVKKSKSHKRVKRSDEISCYFSPADGDSESVGDVRMKYDALRRRITQLEDAKETSSGNRRADLKAGTIMMNKGIRTNTKKRTGPAPGIEIGDIFFFRMEMCLVGVHAPSMAGIDYMIVKFDQEEETVAVSIVSSGGYEDDAEDKDVLIYSGQGGVTKKKGGKDEVTDQKLERGNLALERSLRRGNEVRVIRGMRDLHNPTGKVYVYDGLYKIHESWTEKGKSGCNVFKYKLLRLPGQPEAFGIWKSIQQWRANISARPGLILPDLTSGAEKLPVSLVNDIDDEKGPSHFTYCPSLKYLKPITQMRPSIGCNCRGTCLPGDPNCSCVMKNGGQLPHTATGLLVVRKHLIHECGPSCKCYPSCRNQVSQNGLKVRLEVFKTNDRGWGLRSWDPIRAGTFICEFAGEVVDRDQVEDDRDEDGENDYVFDSTCSVVNPLEWNYLPELLDEESRGDLNEAGKPSLSLVISAKNTGNVARFMNHSCFPNKCPQKEKLPLSVIEMQRVFSLGSRNTQGQKINFIDEVLFKDSFGGEKIQHQGIVLAVQVKDTQFCLL